jgi:23S rRNA (pseudouridine1915-N3)-methyltransferase
MIRLVAVGRPRAPLAEAVRHYEERIGHYWKFEAIEVEAGGGRRGGSDELSVRAEEGERILRSVPDGATLWLVTRDGRALSSVALSTMLGERRLHAAPLLVLAIGGAFGFSAEVRTRAEGLLTLSAMTLPHELARLILAEQLYRAGTILRGEPYHKGPDYEESRR